MLVVHLLAFLGGAAAIACLWIRTKLTYPAIHAQDSPTQGKPEDPVILYGQFALCTTCWPFLVGDCTSWSGWHVTETAL